MISEAILKTHPLKNSRRLRIAFFDFPDVFEDFYTHYGVDQKTFATTWHNTGNHAWLKIVQQEIGDVTWYALSLKPKLQEAHHEYVGCKVKFLSSSWMHKKLWHLFYLPKNAWKWRRFYPLYGTIASYISMLSWPLIKALRKDSPDVIFIQEYSSGRFDMIVLFAKLLRIPIISFHAGSTAETTLGKFMKRFTIPQANVILPSGKNEMQRLQKTYRVPSSKLYIIRPPIDVSIYKYIDRKIACAAANLDPQKRYFVFIGRFDDSVKRISSIIHVFENISKAYHDIDLLIVGNGKDEKKLREQAITQVPGRVHFLGWIPSDEQKAEVLNASECLVIASTREGFPTVIGEAFACGIPVVSSDVGTISDLVIDGKTGWLFKPGDDEAMLKCLTWMAENPEKIKCMKKDIITMAKETVSVEAITRTIKDAFFSIKYRRLNEQ